MKTDYHFGPATVLARLDKARTLDEINEAYQRWYEKVGRR
jgi:hypothetical protein